MTPAQIKAAVQLAIVAGVVAVSFGAGWAVNGWRMGAVAADLRADQATSEAKGATEALKQFKDAAATIQAAAAGAALDSQGINRRLDAIVKEQKNAKPLPVGCRPDDQRLRNRNAAIEAYNDSAAGRQPGGPVREPEAVNRP